MDPLQILILFAVAALASAGATPLVGRLAVALGVVDVPGPRKVNLRDNIPLLGGLAIAFGVTAGFGAAVFFGGVDSEAMGRLFGLLLGGGILLAIGAWDDRFGLGAKTKLVFQIAAAWVAYSYGFRLDFLSDFSQETYPLPEPVAVGVTLLWIVAVTNAMNLMDGLDGLSTGLGTIIAATLTLICADAEQPVGVLLGVVLVGAQLGFLPFNFPPGRIFLGDSGAYFIGYFIAVLGLEGYRKGALFTFVVPLMALAVPLLDTGLSILRRLRDRRRVLGADRMHMHHRLLQVAGGSQRDAVLSLYFLTTCFCVIAYALTSQKVATPYMLGTLVAVVALTLRLLFNLGIVEGWRTKTASAAVAEEADTGDTLGADVIKRENS